jgi:small-conductance mechanosensitive channel
MNKWVAAAIAIAAALVVGSIAARIVRNLLVRPRQPEGLRNSAGAIASLVFSAVMIAGLITALGMVNQESLDRLPEQLVNYVPKALSAAIVLIAANVVSAFAASALERSMGYASPSVRQKVPVLVKGVIFGMAGLIAANQLGVDTTIITLAAASLFFSIGLAASLMIGFGSRKVSGEIAAGRALRQLLAPGDTVGVGPVQGTLVKVHAVAAEILTPGGEVRLVPNSQFLDHALSLVRDPAAATSPDAA